eukprot:TRINITY_DN23_c3_g1_i2.p1 TRINITY_DN23_c3_g1~~TRINITY_DN23_c3_g1_i2.p1  ORF type:complete len:219 (+),score=77.77 TRINITY_DN23_c3_g1_i2:276-932(+)
MARGDLSTAKNKSTALAGRIRDAKFMLAVEKGEEPPEDAKLSKRDKKRVLQKMKMDEDGEVPKQRAEIDIDLKQPGANSKTELASYLQAKVGRAMTKDDIIYKTEKTDSGEWISSLAVPCLDEETATGEPKRERRDAEKSAAQAFLEERRSEIEEMNKDARPIVVNTAGQADREASAKKARIGGPKAGGKGFGKGKDWQSLMYPMMMMMMAKGGKGKW